GDPRARTRQCHRTIRRRAGFLPAGPRYSRGSGPAVDRPRLVRRADRQDRRAARPRAPHTCHRTRTRDNGIENSHLMTTLQIKDLHVSVVSAEDGTDIPILKGVDLTVKSGETHALMGPNGSGKSTLSYAVAGHPKYTVTSGSITLDGQDVLEMSIDERARAGLFLAMQYPIEVPGVSMSNFLRTAATAVRGEAPK